MSVDEAVAAGCYFQLYPEELRARDVDPLLRDVVKRINLCGWAWTAFCCQGHPPGDPKKGRKKPDDVPQTYLVMACRQEDVPRLLGCWYQVLRQFQVPGKYLHGSQVEVAHGDNDAWAQLCLRMDCPTVASRDTAVEALCELSQRMASLEQPGVCSAPTTRPATPPPGSEAV